MQTLLQHVAVIVAEILMTDVENTITDKPAIDADVIDLSSFTYKVRLYDDCGRFLDSDTYTITVPTTDYPEGDEDEARDQAHKFSEQYLDNYDGACDYELSLEDAG